MTEQKLIVCIMGAGNSMEFLPMCYESVKDADAILFVDSGSADGTIEYMKERGIPVIERAYEPENKHWNGQQRNFYLQYLKAKYPDWWCLALDVDEVVDNLNAIKEFISKEKEGLYSVKMRHLMHYINHEDSTKEVHYVLNRLFKINQASGYAEVEHPVLNSIDGKPESYGVTDCTTIWHLSYIPGLWKILKQYEKQLVVSNTHSKDYLKNWYYAHIFGQYPKKEFNPAELPSPIKKRFHLEEIEDELYFQKRKQFEMKHLLDAHQWKDHFHPQKVLLWGDGMGHRTYALRVIGVEAYGSDVSRYAVNHSPYNFKEQGIMWVENIATPLPENEKFAHSYDLVIAYDVLEHISYKELDTALNKVYLSGVKDFLFSIPFLGDPNLTNDPTHIIKESREWWIEKLTQHGFKVKETPQHFVFRHQILVAEK